MSPLNRMVLVRRRAVTLRGPEPLERDGFWMGVVTKVTDKEVRIKLWCGTARQDLTVTMPIESKEWRIRFP